MSSTEATAATQTETKVADKAGTAIETKRQRPNNRNKRQSSRNSSRKPRGGDNKEPRQDEKKRQNSASRRNQRVRKTAGESSPRDKAPNKSNILTIGRRLQMTRYVAIVKNVFAQDRHDVLELHGFGDIGMSKLTQVVNVLTNWDYVHVVKIKTTVDPALKIQIKKTSVFQEKYDAFAQSLQERREERAKAKEEAAQAEASKAEATKAESTKAEAQGESKGESAPTSEADPSGKPKEESK